MTPSIQRRKPCHDIELPEQLDPLLRRIYSTRPLGSADDLELALKELIPPGKLLGMDAAVALLEDALKNRKRLLIVSDFDADGATSCVVGIKALQKFGAASVDYIVPNRFEYGYGLTPEIVKLAETRSPDLLITVDNGISSIDGVAAAKQAGMQVLVTDHHLPASETPAADAIVNPNQHGCSFPSKCIAGVGVIFYIMLALRARLREIDWFDSQGFSEPNMAELLDLVALGTVADVVPLDRNNRILVHEGLRRIRAGHCRPGIAALIRLANRNALALQASDLGFALGPRLNAAGRLDDMATGIECLMAESDSEAHQLALLLDGMNQDRKLIESEMQGQALELLDSLSLSEQELPAGLALFDPRWHQGVVGILASRIKERVHRPVIAFAEVDEGEGADNTLKGSARSIPGFHIRDALDAVASRYPGLISKFGGHAMAAGLSLPKSRFEEFSAAFAAEAERLLAPEQLQAILLSDGELPPELLSLQSAELLQGAGPWGQEFPEPVFDGRFLVLQQQRLKDKHLKMRLAHPLAPGRPLEAIAFNVAEDAWPQATAAEIEIAYKLDVNDFRGQRTLQLMVEKILASV